MAEILRNGNLYHLRNDRISYVLMEMPGGVLAHLYFGARLEGLNAANLLRHANIPSDDGFSVQECALDRLPQEYPSFGLGDMRDGALTVEGPDGSWAVDLRVEKAETLDAKPALEGLPATRGEGCAALRFTMRDAHTGLVALLAPLRLEMPWCPAASGRRHTVRSLAHAPGRVMMSQPSSGRSRHRL